MKPWKKYDIAPGLQLRVRRGHKVSVTNQGTAKGPAWLVRPVLEKPAAQVPAPEAEAGALFFAPAAASALAKALERGRKRRAALAEDPWESEVPAGETVELGAILIDSDGKKVRV